MSESLFEAVLTTLSQPGNGVLFLLCLLRARLCARGLANVIPFHPESRCYSSILEEGTTTEVVSSAKGHASSHNGSQPGTARDYLGPGAQTGMPGLEMAQPGCKLRSV